MLRSLALATAIRTLRLALCILIAFQLTEATAAPPPGYELAWADEFDGIALDESRWWYRADQKHQSIQLPGNIEVSGGNLILNLTPLATPINGFDAAGAGVISQQRFRYGYYETRSKLGDGVNDDNDELTDEGWWHAFWAMAAEADENGHVVTTFPPLRRTEIDAYENGSNDLTHFTQHVLQWNQQGQIIARLPSSDVSTIPASSINDWHTYGFEWTPSEVRFFVDDIYQHSAIYPADVYEHNDVNVWLTAISTNWLDSHQELSKASYDYFRFYAPGNIEVNAGEELAIGADHELGAPVGGSLVSGFFGANTYDGGSISGNVLAKNGSLIHGVGSLSGNLTGEPGSTIRVGSDGIVVEVPGVGVSTGEDFEAYAPGDAYVNGMPTGLVPTWTFFDLGGNSNDAQFSISGGDGTANQPTDSHLTGESQMLHQRATGLDFAMEASGGEPFAGAVAVSDNFDTSGTVDIIEADFVLDGFGDGSAQNLDTKLVFGFRDIDNWFALSLVAGAADGTSTQVDVTASINGNRENVFGRVGDSVFDGNFPQDTLLHARVVHDKSLGYVEFSISNVSSGEVLAESFVVDDRFKADGKVGFAVNNDATGYDNFQVTTWDTLPASQVQSLAIDGDYSQHAGATLEIDLATSAVYDRLVIDGNASLAGTLAIKLPPGMDLPLGVTLEVLTTTGTASGQFDSLVLPVLPLGRAIQLVYGSSQVSIEVVLAGDYNHDGIVNLADYTVWRDAFGAAQSAGTGADLSGDGVIGMEEYDIWRMNFGLTRDEVLTARSYVLVPEPATMVLLLISIVWTFGGKNFYYHIRRSNGSHFTQGDL